MVHCKCPLSGVKRTCQLHCEMSAFDPKRTSEWFQTTPSKAPVLASTMVDPECRGSNEAARIHHALERRGGNLAFCRAGAADCDACGRLASRRICQARPSHCA